MTPLHRLNVKERNGLCRTAIFSRPIKNRGSGSRIYFRFAGQLNRQNADIFHTQRGSSSVVTVADSSLPPSPLFLRWHFFYSLFSTFLFGLSIAAKSPSQTPKTGRFADTEFFGFQSIHVSICSSYFMTPQLLIFSTFIASIASTASSFFAQSVKGAYLKRVP